MTSKLVKAAKKSSFQKSALMGMIDEKVNKLAAEVLPTASLEVFKSGQLAFRIIFLGSIAKAANDTKIADACLEWMEIINA